MAHKKCIEEYKKSPTHQSCDCIMDDLKELEQIKQHYKTKKRKYKWENSKFAKKCKKIWNSNGKRYKAVKFICAFCGCKKYNETYSVLDGLPSCEMCDILW